MGWLDLFGGDSTSNVSNKNYDEKVGASDNAVAQRIETAAGATVNVGSDQVAKQSIDQANALAASAIAAGNTVSGNALAQSLSFLGDQLTALFHTVDSRAASSDANAEAAQTMAREVISASQATSSDDLRKLIWVAGGLGVLAFAIKEGYFK